MITGIGFIFDLLDEIIVEILERASIIRGRRNYNGYWRTMNAKLETAKLWHVYFRPIRPKGSKGRSSSAVCLDKNFNEIPGTSRSLSFPATQKDPPFVKVIVCSDKDCKRCQGVLECPAVKNFPLLGCLAFNEPNYLVDYNEWLRLMRSGQEAEARRKFKRNWVNLGAPPCSKP